MRIIDATAALAGGPLRPTGFPAHVPVTRELSGGEIGWELAPGSPWPPASPVLALAIEALPAVEDDLAARLTERMALTIADLADELRAVRAVLSASMTQAYEQQLVIDRLHRQIVEMREAGRAKGRVAA